MPMIGQVNYYGIFLSLSCYSAEYLGEIADDIVAIDQAMKWGFGWELGPFELWDAIGLEESVKKVEEKVVKCLGG